MIYKLYKAGLNKDIDAAMTVDAQPQVSFIFDENNTDYQAFLLWKSEGNEPLPADE